MQTEARIKVVVRRDTRTALRDRATTLPNDSAKADNAKANPSSESEEVKLRDASKSVAEAKGRSGDICL